MVVNMLALNLRCTSDWLEFSIIPAQLIHPNRMARCDETGNRPIFFFTFFLMDGHYLYLGQSLSLIMGRLEALLYSIFTWDIFLYFSLSIVRTMVASGDSFAVT